MALQRKRPVCIGLIMTRNRHGGSPLYYACLAEDKQILRCLQDNRLAPPALLMIGKIMIYSMVSAPRPIHYVLGLRLLANAYLIALCNNAVGH